MPVKITQWKRRAEGVKIEGEVFHRLDLRSMKAFGSQWIGCSFVDCQLDMADLRASKFERCTFQNSAVRLVNFATSFFEDSLFLDCDLEQASFMGAHFRDGGFKDCRMAYGDTMFQDATLKGRIRFEECNLHGSNLDFRESEPKGVSFERCNLWGAKMAMGCAFWNATFDERTVQQFLALVARVSQDSHIAGLAGDQYRVVCRAMDGTKNERDTTIPQTTSPILSFPDALIPEMSEVKP